MISSIRKSLISTSEDNNSKGKANSKEEIECPVVVDLELVESCCVVGDEAKCHGDVHHN